MQPSSGHITTFYMWKEPSWQDKGASLSRPGSQRLEERLLEPTFSAPPPGATAAACGTGEYSAALHDAFREVRDHPQTLAHGCPWAALHQKNRWRTIPPPKTTDPPQNPTPVAGTCARRRLHTARRDDAGPALGSAQGAPAPAPPAVKPSQSLRQRAARQIASWPRGCSLSSCPSTSCASLPANPPHSACLCDRSGGSARPRGAPERRVCTQPASQQQQQQ